MHRHHGRYAIIFNNHDSDKIITYALGDKVRIDYEVDAVIIGIAVYPSGVEYKVSWWNNGAIHDAWLADWRVDKETA